MPRNTDTSKKSAKGEPGERKLTPAMRQYMDVKETHPDALLLFQMGDFYETFYEDAKQLAVSLSITLTQRGKDGDEPIPLAGFPMKALDGYLPKLVAAGHRVVICDQIGDPKLAKGVVERAVTRVVTPGTLVEETLLDPGAANHIAALVIKKDRYGLAWVELSTGAFHLCGVDHDTLGALLTAVDPAELVVSDATSGEARDFCIQLEQRYSLSLSLAPDWTFNPPQALKTLKDHFGVASLGGFGIQKEKEPEVVAAGAVLAYLKDQQRASLPHIAKLEPYALDDSLTLDPATVGALELVETLRGGQRKHSLLWAMDACATSMGSRLLRSWLLAPLTSAKAIALRHAAVEELAYHGRRREMLRESLDGLSDLERLAGRLGCLRATPRDLVALGQSLRRVPLLANALSGAESSLLSELATRLDPCEEILSLIEKGIADDPPHTLKDGGVIRDGFNPELDELRTMQREGKRYIARFQAEEMEKSGIPNLKVGYTSVFGYYLEITNTHKDKVPDYWIRKQTLKNAERYITPELKEIETKVLNAESEGNSLESRLYTELREELAAQSGRVVATARIIAIADLLAGFAQIAVDRAYVRPEVSEGRELQLTDGRHPVLDLTLESGPCVPNDCHLNADAPMALITGPNMAGKSTYIRMVALLTLMAQAGSFVPAQEFRFGLVDRIFTRLGSADEIQRGNSTFMVEMVETANILNNASDRSLVVLDEVGRGTSTFDGVSIAWSITEYLADQLRARTLFATHYHELTQLASRLTSVRNYNVSVREWGEEIIFLHKIVEGAADRSYGIHVARLAGLPGSVINRSKQIMGRLENETAALQSMPDQQGGPQLKRPRRVQLTLFTPAENQVVKALEELDADAMPLEALRAEIARLKSIAGE